MVSSLTMTVTSNLVNRYSSCSTNKRSICIAKLFACYMLDSSFACVWIKRSYVFILLFVLVQCAYRVPINSCSCFPKYIFPFLFCFLTMFSIMFLPFSGIPLDRKGFAPSHPVITEEPMASLWCMMSLIRYCKYYLM